jgi:hyperosmotically inducible protein
MRNYCRIVMLVLSFIFLTSCQTNNHGMLFQPQNNDLSLTAAVSATLKSNRDLAPYNIHVETANGTVYLSGYVKTIRQSDTAGDVAGKVPGVKTVENNIIVRK